MGSEIDVVDVAAKAFVALVVETGDEMIGRL